MNSNRAVPAVTALRTAFVMEQALGQQDLLPQLSRGNHQASRY